MKEYKRKSITGKEIKDRRGKLELKQKDLAQLLNVSTRTIINYEGGSVIPLKKQKPLIKILYPQKNYDLKKELMKNPKFKELSEDEKLNLIYKEIQEIKKYIENHEKEIYRASLKAFADNPELVRAILESKNNVELIKKES